MYPQKLPFWLSIFTIFFLIHLVLAEDYVPTVKILLSCGGPSGSTDAYGRQWISDIGSKFASSIDKSLVSASAYQNSSVPQVPFMNARISLSEFTYSFPIGPGRKFVRFYFYPSIYDGFDSSNAVFSVTSGPYSLLKNFSAIVTTGASESGYVVKEFSINVQSDTLNVTFTPEKDFAFINGIEIVSHPDIYNLGPEYSFVASQSPGLTFDNSTILENFYRLNVGGNDIPPSSDTGLFRSWFSDTSYINGSGFGVTEKGDPNLIITYPPETPSYVAPLDVYETLRSMGPVASVNLMFNLTWGFDVESGFYYFIRLHFCEALSDIQHVNQRVFEVFLNDQTVEKAADVIAWGGKNGVALHRDYVVFVPQGEQVEQLLLAVHPSIDSKPQYYDAILNGVEIFKIIDTQGNLGGGH